MQGLFARRKSRHAIEFIELLLYTTALDQNRARLQMLSARNTANVRFTFKVPSDEEEQQDMPSPPGRKARLFVMTWFKRQTVRSLTFW